MADTRSSSSWVDPATEEDKPSWSDERLFASLEVPKQEARPAPNTWGWDHVLLAACAVCLSAVVLACNVVSRVSLVALVSGYREVSRLGTPVDDMQTHVAFLLLLLVMLVPQALSFLSSMWRSVYMTKKRNPWPSPSAVMYTLLQALLEVAGLTLLIMVVAPRLHPQMVSLLLPLIFIAPAFELLWAKRKGLLAPVAQPPPPPADELSPNGGFDPTGGGGAGGWHGGGGRPGSASASMGRGSPNLGSASSGTAPGSPGGPHYKTHFPRRYAHPRHAFPYSQPPLHEEDVEHGGEEDHGGDATTPLLDPPQPLHKGLYQKRRSRGTALLECGAAAVFVTSLLYVPVYLWIREGSQTASWMAPLAALMLSISLLPVLQEWCLTPSRRDPSNPELIARNRGSVIGSFVRMCLTVGAGVCIVALDDRLHFDKLHEAISHIGESHFLTPFCVHVVSSFLGFHAARLACFTRLQRVAFALPLLFSTPGALAVCTVFCDLLPFGLTMDCYPTQHLPGLIVIATFLWIGETILTAPAAWNNQLPRLAMDEKLFYQPRYIGVALEQFTLLNRKSPERVSTVPVLSAHDELQQSRIFVCTTMFREEAHEMKRVVQSIIKLDSAMPGLCESHIFMDGGIQGNGYGRYALQLLACLGGVLKPEHVSLDDWLTTGRRIATPYGQRMEFALPNGMPLVVHFKNGALVKSKKRWSQVMYMYYFLQFRVPKDMPTPYKTYILTTDADVEFEPEDVQALLMVLAHDNRIGAVCGRTYPIGSGPFVWYQKFDYAVGHWFQKTAEHVLGTVLCCPGCFSMFRTDALRETLTEYSTSVSKPSEFLTKDMGEDRWLCTLLVLNGWRLAYTSAASNSTFCPTSFREFFGQRRRWVPSTVANILELLSHYGEATRNNDSVSTPFIIYQMAMLFSSLISPATVILVIMGGLFYVFNLHLVTLLGWLVAITLAFWLVCLVLSQDTQLLIAELLTILCSIVMGIVVVGIFAEIGGEIADERSGKGKGGIPGTTALSITTVYLAAIAGIFIASGLVHLREFFVLMHSIWYLLGLPGGYLLLTIYSFCNLNDRRWGTREEARASSSSSSGWLPDLLAGCGRWPDESLSHFFGRLLCCRGSQAPKTTSNPYGLLGVEEEDPDDPQWTLSEDATTASCRSVTVLLQELGRVVSDEQQFLQQQQAASRLSPPQQHQQPQMVLNLQEAPTTASATPLSASSAASSRRSSVSSSTGWGVSEATIQKLGRLTKDALRACPTLSSWGNWQTYWDSGRESFRAKRSAARVLSDPQFWARMKTEVEDHMRQQYTWTVTETNPRQEPEHVLHVQAWLRNVGLDDPFLVRQFVTHGYDDTTFFVGLSEDDLRAIGVTDTLAGRAHTRKLLEAAGSLPRTHIPEVIPVSLTDWLTHLSLTCYIPNFERFGYRQTDLPMLEGLTERELRQMGISRRAHLKKLKQALAKLGELLAQGRSPEGPSEAHRKETIVRVAMNSIAETALDSSLLADRNVLGQEREFWMQLVKHKLDPRVEPIGNVEGLKEGLLSLRNVGVLVLFTTNALWIVLMYILSQSTTQSLNVFHTNPLGFVFLILYGGVFAIQFLSLLWHRAEMLVQHLSSIPWPPGVS